MPEGSKSNKSNLLAWASQKPAFLPAPCKAKSFTRPRKTFVLHGLAKAVGMLSNARLIFSYHSMDLFFLSKICFLFPKNLFFREIKKTQI